MGLIAAALAWLPHSCASQLHLNPVQRSIFTVLSTQALTINTTSPREAVQLNSLHAGRSQTHLHSSTGELSVCFTDLADAQLKFSKGNAAKLAVTCHLTTLAFCNANRLLIHASTLHQTMDYFAANPLQSGLIGTPW